MQGWIQDFKLGGRTLKNCNERREARKFLGVFRVKNHDFTPKNHIFSNFRGRAGCALPVFFWSLFCLLINCKYMVCSRRYIVVTIDEASYDVDVDVYRDDNTSIFTLTKSRKFTPLTTCTGPEFDVWKESEISVSYFSEKNKVLIKI
jgi:hypothetical protein